MDRDRLVMIIASVFLGITTLLLVLAFTKTLFLLFVAVPFGLTSYFMWYQASGRLHRRMRRRTATGATGADRFSGFGAGARRTNERFNAGGGARRTGRRPPSRSATLPREEAYRALGLDASADEETVRRAYRKKVKEVHPDTENGDEEAFKRVNRAYETLTE